MFIKVIIPTIFTGKRVKFLEITLEAVIGGNELCKYSWFRPSKVKNDPELVRDSNSSIKFLTFQLSNVRELETIKHAFAKLQ